jgi:hypothetical protein
MVQWSDHSPSNIEAILYGGSEKRRGMATCQWQLAIGKPNTIVIPEESD